MAMAQLEDPTHQSVTVGTSVRMLRSGTATSQHHAAKTTDRADRGGTLSSRTISQMIKGYLHKTLDRPPLAAQFSFSSGESNGHFLARSKRHDPAEQTDRHKSAAFWGSRSICLALGEPHACWWHLLAYCTYANGTPQISHRLAKEVEDQVKYGYEFRRTSATTYYRSGAGHAALGDRNSPVERSRFPNYSATQPC